MLSPFPISSVSHNATTHNNMPTIYKCDNNNIANDAGKMMKKMKWASTPDGKGGVNTVTIIIRREPT